MTPTVSSKIFSFTIRDYAPEKNLFSSSTMIFVSRMMLTIAGKKLQVFNAIIRPNPVPVMYDFFRGKISPQVFFHYKSMLLNIILIISKWMAMAFNKNISIRVNHSPSIPSSISAQFNSFSKPVGRLVTASGAINSSSSINLSICCKEFLFAFFTQAQRFSSFFFSQDVCFHNMKIWKYS